MTEEEQNQRGILSPDERKFLAGEDDECSGRSENERYEEIRTRVASALLDFEYLFFGLRDEDVDWLLENSDGKYISASLHDVLVVVFYLLIRGDEQLEGRIGQAIQHAYAVDDQRAAPEIDIVTEPFLPPDQRIKALASDGSERVSFGALEKLIYDTRARPKRLASALEGSIVALTEEEIRDIREEISSLERVPLSAVLSVDIEDPKDDEQIP